MKVNLAIVVGRGIGWLITVMIANMFNKCSKKTSRPSSMFKEGGRAAPQIGYVSFMRQRKLILV